MSGVKGRSGRKKSPKNVLKYLTEQIDDNWGELVEALVDKARNGDREALFYCFDRRLGKPKAVTELTGADGQALGPGAVVLLYSRLEQMQREALEPPKLLGKGE